MLRALVPLALAAGLALPAEAAPPTKAELLQKAAEGAAVCGQLMPDGRQMGEALKAGGYKLEQANGSLKAYASLGKRVVVLVTGNRPGNDGCVVLVSGMTVPEAEALIQPWVKMSAARPGPIPDSPAGGFAKGWVGDLRGRPYSFGIAEHINTRIVRGAAIVARSMD